jgi:hypothetical protein
MGKSMLGPSVLKVICCSEGYGLLVSLRTEPNISACISVNQSDDNVAHGNISIPVKVPRGALKLYQAYQCD